MKTDNSRNDDVSIKLATYMERLDNYIQTQTNLNESICKNLENIEEELAEVISLAEVRHQRRYSFNHPSFYNKLKMTS